MSNKLETDPVEVTKADIVFAFILWFLPLCLGVITFLNSKYFDLIIELILLDKNLFAVIVFLFMALTNLGRFVEICHSWTKQKK